MKPLMMCIVISAFLVMPAWCLSARAKEADVIHSPDKFLSPKSQKNLPPVMDNVSAEREVDSMSMDEAVALAIQYNPELKSAEKEIDAATARIIQAKLLPNPSLFLETEDGSSKSIGFGKDYKSVFGLSQPILLGGKISARTRLAQKEKDLAATHYELKLRLIVAETKKAFVAVLAAQKFVAIASENLEIAKKLLESVQTRVDALAAPETEKIKAEIELSHAQVSASRAITQFRQAQKQLNTLLGLFDLQVKSFSGTLQEEFPQLNKDKAEEWSMVSYPEVSRVGMAKELSEAQLQLARAERYPDIDFGIGAGKIREARESTNIIEWAITIPLPLFDRNQGRILESKMLIAKAEKDYEDTWNKVRSEIQQTLSSFDNMRDQAKTYSEQVLPQAERSLTLALEGYHWGQLTYLELLDAQRTLSQTRENYIWLLKDLNEAAVEIERLTGKPLNELE